MTLGSLTEPISSLRICLINNTGQKKLYNHVLPRQRDLTNDFNNQQPSYLNPL